MIYDLLERVKSFNEHAMLKQLHPTPKLIDADSYKLNHDLIVEEVKEYLEACKDGDLIEVADAVGDLMFVLWGIICKHGMHNIFFEQIFAPICDSNETKYCPSRSEAMLSIMNLQNKKSTPHNYSEWNGSYVIFDTNSGKLAKGINYKEPVFTFLDK